MSTLSCPHCGQNAAIAPFCEHCGMALPAPVPVSPHVVNDVNNIQNSATRAMFTEDLYKKVKSASTCLITVGILCFIFAGVIFALSRNNSIPQLAETLVITSVIQVILGLIFTGLFFWCKKAPLPATMTGFFIYLTVVIANVVIVNLNRTVEDTTRRGPSNMGIGCLDIVILAVLIKGVKASLDIREINKRNRVANLPPAPPAQS